MKIGDKIKFSNHEGQISRWFTHGKVYVVTAAEGNKDASLGGKVLAGGFIVMDDDNQPMYCKEIACVFGEWEQVK